MSIKTNFIVNIILFNCKKTLIVTLDIIWYNPPFWGTSEASRQRGFFQNICRLPFYRFAVITFLHRCSGGPLGGMVSLRKWSNFLVFYCLVFYCIILSYVLVCLFVLCFYSYFCDRNFQKTRWKDMETIWRQRETTRHWNDMETTWKRCFHVFSTWNTSGAFVGNLLFENFMTLILRNKLTYYFC